MKFGKHIQAQQVPGWSQYYLDYKFLKKIISSLADKRPASEAAALALGIRPGESPRAIPVSSPVVDDSLGQPPISVASVHDQDRGPDFQAHKAAFFFKLERELEKINTFYLQRQAELKLRLERLLSKRRAAAVRGIPENIDGITLNNVEWNAIEEGFRLLERDLGKLQQYVELNATGFRKILKKFDKRSTSTTKELYLSRQVDVQPVFNRQLISEMSDAVAACLLDLTDLSSGLGFEGDVSHDIFTQQILRDPLPYRGPFREFEKQMREAVLSSEESKIIHLVQFSDSLAQENGGRINVLRMLWSLIVEAPPDLADLILASVTTPFDFDFIDDISGRTCLHEASIAGALRLVERCIREGVHADTVDVYGRTAVHYAAMRGHTAVCERLLETGQLQTLLQEDKDHYSPLVYAVLQGSADCVKILLDKDPSRAQALSKSGDLMPLSLASQAGHLNVAMLLLESGAQGLPNSNGEYPMHLAAREGHANVCQLLLHLEGWDTPDKYHEWSPLFHAARFGHTECVRILLDAGCRVEAMDEMGRLAVHYAAWHGHDDCVNLILLASSPRTATFSGVSEGFSPASDMSKGSEADIDMIPSLLLPPPIMPHRVYGHNYLDRAFLVQVSFHGIVLHHRLMSRVFRDEYLLSTTPLKLVITTGPNSTSAPYTISLPYKEKDALYTFQIPALEELSLHFNVHPSFGTKAIGRAVALPSLFRKSKGRDEFVLPILDHRLHVIGEVSFSVNIIRPFNGVTLQVGGDVETYWKSTTISGAQSQSASQPRVVNFSPSMQTSPSAMSTLSTNGHHVSTVSSLKGEYLRVVVQATRDLHPVVFTEHLVPHVDFNLCASDITLEQFQAVAVRSGKNVETGILPNAHSWSQALAQAMLSLLRLLQMLPPSIGLNIEFRHSAVLSGVPTLDESIDCLLRTLHTPLMDPTGGLVKRSVIFTSASTDICAALNWKQPNYPVFLSYGRAPTEHLAGRCESVSAAVEFARLNNLLGLSLPGDLLSRVPSLIEGIGNAGLLVGGHGLEPHAPNEESAVDFWENKNVLVFPERPENR